MIRLYNKTFLMHFSNPKNVGELENPDFSGEAQHSGSGCLDHVRLFISSDKGRIFDARFKARACSGTIAAMSAMTEYLKGRSLEDAGAFTAGILNDLLGGMPMKKVHSIDLAVRVLKEALGCSKIPGDPSDES